MRNTMGKEGGENEKSGFCSLLLAASETGCILGDREEREERGGEENEVQRGRNMERKRTWIDIETRDVFQLIGYEHSHACPLPAASALIPLLLPCNAEPMTPRTSLSNPTQP